MSDSRIGNSGLTRADRTPTRQQAEARRGAEPGLVPRVSGRTEGRIGTSTPRA